MRNIAVNFKSAGQAQAERKTHAFFLLALCMVLPMAGIHLPRRWWRQFLINEAVLNLIA
jgi:hypothetical protein